MNREKLIEVFLEKNSQINLSAIRDADGVLIKHIHDSIELNSIFQLEKWQTVCDVWTGGWFPLLPLAMTNPDVAFIGVDSVWKKVRAINDMIKSLELKNVRALPLRAEEYKTQFDVVTARAVAHVDKLLPWVNRLIKTWWCLVLYKQVSEEERKSLLILCRRFHLMLEKEHEYELAWMKRVIYVLRK